MVNNDLTGYTGNVPVPSVNPYGEGQGEGRAITYGEEYRGYKADLNMAQYNAQMAEAQLLKQRQWALEDRDYNSPGELRKRLEDAGYNPALMSGAIQTANAPVRGSNASDPGARAGTGQGGSRATTANMLQAGQNIISSLMANKQLQQMQSATDLNKSLAVKALSESNLQGSQKRSIDQMLPYQTDALKKDIELKEFDVQLKDQQLREVIPQQVANMQKINELNAAQIAEIANKIGIANKLLPHEINQLKAITSKALSDVNVNDQQVQTMKLGRDDTRQTIEMKAQQILMQKIQNEVKGDTKFASKVNEWVSILKGILSYSGSNSTVNVNK
nr:MAG: DNA pilot protein [Microvirus sp.]